VNKFFGMCGMGGWAWLRTIVAMIIIFIIAEVEKALVDPVLAPIYRPILAGLEKVTPKWLQNSARQEQEDALRAFDHPQGPNSMDHAQNGGVTNGTTKVVTPTSETVVVEAPEGHQLKKDTAFGQKGGESRV
jgi:hypothetical protein